MTEKLVKTGNDYILYSKDKTVLGITSGTIKGRMLSLKNCQAIENGYDLGGLIEEVREEFYQSRLNLLGENTNKVTLVKETAAFSVGFDRGFKKALEFIGDKKFSEEDLFNFIKFRDEYFSQQHLSLEEFIISDKELFDNCQSLQQTEWDVEIVMDICGDKVYAVPELVLDADGCLILRRI